MLAGEWEPDDEEKIGYVWTFQSCVDDPWAPELLPWERFSRKPEKGPAEMLLVLWVDEDAVPRPLRGISAIVDTLARGGLPCDAKGASGLDERRKSTLDKLARREEAEAKLGREEALEKLAKGEEPRPRCASVDNRPEQFWDTTRVVGPWTSEALKSLAGELVDPSPAWPKPPWLRFYSSAATAPSEEVLDAVIERWPEEKLKEKLKERFGDYLVRLTTTDDKLAGALVEELKLRLVDPHPFWRLTNGWKGRDAALCDATVVIVAEEGSTYTDFVQKSFEWGFGAGVRSPAAQSSGAKLPAWTGRGVA